ncbi:hypothetical protein FRC17_002187 [Serendipita sp. 399]|nr:hypothetical protein FRC17_002187 [Serendipita sp. 399]
MSSKGKGRGRGRGRPNDSPEVQLSKTLSYILRHGAKGEGLEMRSDGYVKLEDLLRRPKLRGIDFEQIKEVVETNEKQRFTLLLEPDHSAAGTSKQADQANLPVEVPHPVSLTIPAPAGSESPLLLEDLINAPGTWYIRANQGHSLKVEELELKEIQDASEIPVAIHGTTLEAWKAIAQRGLSVMGRNHAHLASGMVGQSGVISGMRKSSQVLIYIDTERAIGDGIKFFLSQNGVILTPGNEEGFLPKEYFLKGRTSIKLTARMILASMLLYALLNYGDMAPNRAHSSVASSHASIPKADVTYWSKPSAPRGTATPDHVQGSEHPAAPVPEDVFIPEHGDISPDATETAAGGGSLDDKFFEIDPDKEDFEELIQKLLKEAGTDTGEESIPIQYKEDQPPAPSQTTKTKSEEELAEEKRLKDLETKEKREAIEGRHTKWEEKIEKAGAAELADLMEAARKMRNDVVQGMRTTPEMFDLLKKMQQDGTKHIYNTDKYLVKLQKEGAKDDAVKSKWEEIVRKVQKKLDDRTIETTTYLKNWYEGVMKKEKVIFEAAAQKVHEIASNAQDDLGMDYAWLDDVSVDDWTRYHGLKDAAKKWSEEFESVFNSTHIEMLDNPVQTELLQVETAMIRVAADLNKLLDDAKTRGESWLKGETENLDSTGESPAAPVEQEPQAPSPAEADDPLAVTVDATGTYTTPRHKEL